MSSADGLDPGLFVDGGEIKVAKLVGTLLGAVWLSVVSGWISVGEAIAQIHIQVINGIADGWVSIITTYGGQASSTQRVVWASALKAALETSPMLAPLLMSIEVAIVWGVIVTVRRRAVS